MSSRREIRERVAKGFPKEIPDDFAKDYLKDVRVVIRDAVQSLRRYAALVIILIACFELLNRKAVGFTMLGIVRVDKPDLVMVAIPPFVAYSLYQYIVHIAEVVDATHVHDEVIRVRFRSVYDEDLEAFLSPATSLLHQARRISLSSWRETDLKFYLAINTLQVLTPYVAFVAFEVYAYVQLFLHTELSNTMVAVSLAVTIIIFFVAISYMNVSSEESFLDDFFTMLSMLKPVATGVIRWRQDRERTPSPDSRAGQTSSGVDVRGERHPPSAAGPS